MKSLLFQYDPLNDIVSSIMNTKSLNANRWIYGTCEGQCFEKPKYFIMLSVINHCKHNGDFKESLIAFLEKSQKDKKDFVIAEIWNTRLYNYLLNLGFEKIKKFNGLTTKYGNIDRILHILKVNH